MDNQHACNSGILRGVGSLTDEHLAMVTGPDLWSKLGKRPPYYRHKTIYRLLEKHISVDVDLRPLAAAVLERIAGNFDESGLTIRQTCSPKNWRFEPKPDYSPHSTRREVPLEREWIKCQIGTLWCNQIPVASGFTGPTSGKKRAIDLGWNRNKDSAVFVELKVTSDHPVYAAFEIFSYGMLYLFARRCRTAPYRTRPWMEKKQILLTVLAPAAFYEGYPANTWRWLERSLNTAVATVAADHTEDPLQMGFCFSNLPKDFQWQRPANDLAKAIRSVEDGLTRKMACLFP